MKQSALLLLTASLSLCAPVYAQEAATESRPEVRTNLKLEEVVPKDTFLFLGMSGLEAASKAAEGLDALNIWQEAEVQEFLKLGIDKYLEHADKMDEGGKRKWDLMKSYAQGRLALALTGIGLSGSMPTPSMVMALDIGDKKEEASGLLSQLLDSMSPMMDQFDVEQGEKAFKGHPIRTFKVNIQGFDAVVCQAIVGNLLMVSLGQGPINRAINYASAEKPRNLSSTDSWQRSRGKANGTPILEMFINPRYPTKKFRLFIPSEVLTEIERLGINGLEGIYFASTIENGDCQDLLYLDAPSPRSGLMALNDGKSLTEECFHFIPKDALVAVAGRANIQKLYDEAMTSVKALAEAFEQGREFEGAMRQMRQMESQIGFSIRDDLLNALGDELVLYASLPEALRLPRIAAMISLRDEAKAEALILRYWSMLGRQAKLSKKPFGQRMVHTMTPKRWTTTAMTPCWCITNGRLVISATYAGMRDALARIDGKVDSDLRQHPEFDRVYKGLHPQHAGIMTWIDTRRVLTFGYDIVENIVPGLVASERCPVDLTMIPRLETLAKHFHSAGSTLYGDKDGIVGRARIFNYAAIVALASRIVNEAPGYLPAGIQGVQREMFARSGSTRSAGGAEVARGGGVGGRFGGTPLRAEPAAESTASAGGTDIINPLSKDDPEAVSIRQTIKQMQSRAQAGQKMSPAEHFRIASLHARVSQNSEAVAHYQQAIAGGHNLSTSTYNLACCLSLMGTKEPALDALELAIKRGFNSKNHLKNDSDLNAIRSEPRFAKIMRAMSGSGR